MSRPLNPSTTGWWRRATVYQIYPRSFADGNGDGIGDLGGLRSRLRYLDDLGVDAIWINPWFPSPLADGGYDVADYRDIHPDFGTLTEAQSVIDEAHRLGLRVIIDLVPNHTSDQHPWFQAALAAEPGSAERDRYIFRPGLGPDGDQPPTNWSSVFGGSAWDPVADGFWYLHLFDASQPDLNWVNDEVRDEFDDIFRFWLDRDIDGFRIDVAHGLIKDPTFPPTGEFDPNAPQGADDGSHPHWDRDGIHQLNRRWRRVLEQYDDRMMVAEANVPAARRPLYLRPDEYHQAFNFDLLLRATWSAPTLSKIITEATEAAAAVGSAPTWAWSNHDTVRHPTRFGLPAELNPRRWLLQGPHDVLDAARGARRARAAALITLALPGSAYLYQGEELGLPEVWDLPLDVLQDPAWRRSNHHDKGRDGSRVPLPWTTNGPSFGFGSGRSWLPQPEHFGPLSVEAQDRDPTSALNLHREALTIRRRLFVHDETIDMIDLGPDVLAFQRGNGAMVVANLGDGSLVLPDRVIALASDPLTGDADDPLLPPDTSVWLEPPSTIP